MDINVKHIAKLAMLDIPQEGLAKIEKEMQDILNMVENLPPIESADSLIDKNNLMQLREDKIIPSYSREEMLQNAPRAVAGCLVVPKTVEE